MPRCIHCKEKFVKRYPSQMGKYRFCLAKDDCIKEFNRVVKEQEHIKREKKRKSDAKNKINLHPEIYHGELKKELQRWINHIARLIDKDSGCIDCDRMESKAWDGGHRHSRGNNPSLRWNLHNIHNQTRHCNSFSEGNKHVYDQGIENKYGAQYRELVESLPLFYPELKLPHSELPEKLKTSRAIYRELKTLNQVYPPEVRIRLREEYNKRIGIY